MHTFDITKLHNIENRKGYGSNLIPIVATQQMKKNDGSFTC